MKAVRSWSPSLTRCAFAPVDPLPEEDFMSDEQVFMVNLAEGGLGIHGRVDDHGPGHAVDDVQTHGCGAQLYMPVPARWATNS